MIPAISKLAGGARSEPGAVRHDMPLRLPPYLVKCISQRMCWGHLHIANLVIRQIRNKDNAVTLGFGQQPPGCLTVNFVSVMQASLKRFRASFVKPFQKSRMTQAIAALGQQNNRTAISASVRGHVESFVCLNEIKVIRRTATAGYNNFALLAERY